MRGPAKPAKRARVGDSARAQPTEPSAAASARAEGGTIDVDKLRHEPVYSLIYPDAAAAAAKSTTPALALVASEEHSLTRDATGELPSLAFTDERPGLVLPGDRVMVDMNDPAVHGDSEFTRRVADLRHPELVRHHADSALDQLLLDSVMAERFSRRATATGNASNRHTDSQSAANIEERGRRWEPAVVIGTNRDMLALNTYTGDKIYVFNRTKSSKAFNDTSMIHTCHGCKSRMRVPRPCDVLVCFQCKTKIAPPPPRHTLSGRSNSNHASRSRGSVSCTDLPLRAIPPLSSGDFVGLLKPGDEVEVQVVYKHAHRSAARAWVKAKVIGRANWAGAADALQLMVPYPSPSATAPRSAAGQGPRGAARDDWPDYPASQSQKTLMRGGGTGSSGETADPEPSLELPAGNRFGSATVELPPIVRALSADDMPDPVPILVSTDLTLLCERAVSCQQIARDRPHELAEMHIMVSDPPYPSGMPGTRRVSEHATTLRVRSMRTAVVLSFVPGLQRHVVAYSEQEVKLIDLKAACFVLEPATSRIYHPSVLGKPGTHIKDCPVCFEPFDWSSLGRISMRCHPRACCSTCLSSWANGQIAEGKLYVRCPAEGCKKHLALSQVKQTVGRSKYNSFVSSIREVHREAARAEQEKQSAGTEEEQKAFREWVKKMDVRFCTGCFARIEKNKGCNHMTCWRCGTEFQWDSAPPVSGGLPEVEATTRGDRGGRADRYRSRPSLLQARAHKRSAVVAAPAAAPSSTSSSLVTPVASTSAAAAAPTMAAAAAAAPAAAASPFAPSRTQWLQLDFTTDDEEEDKMISPVQRQHIRSPTSSRRLQRPRTALDSPVATSNRNMASTGANISSTSPASAATTIDKGVYRSPGRRLPPPNPRKRQRTNSQCGAVDRDCYNRVETCASDQNVQESEGLSRQSPRSPRRSSRIAAIDAVTSTASKSSFSSPRRYATRASRQKQVVAATPGAGPPDIVT